MGHAKKMQMKYEERGYGESEKYVCGQCIGNEHLKSFVYNNGTEDEFCDFCENEDVCISIEDLCDEVMCAIEFEYERAIGPMGWDGAEGGYIGATIWHIYDLLEELNAFMLLEPTVLNEIHNIVGDDTWCEIDPYSLRANEENKYMWQRFSEMVKHKTRYVFFRMPEYDNEDEKSNYLILDNIGEAVDRLELIEVIPEGAYFYRGRTHLESVKFFEEKDLCPPASCLAPANRMSAEGVSIFYGANTASVALAEIKNGKKCATIAEFVNLRELKILNLADNYKFVIPCLFNKKQRGLREDVKFLNELNCDLTRKIEDMKTIEYIPVQVVAEYFRFLYEHNGERIDGIAYKSSKCEDGVCYALFFDNEQCIAGDKQELQIRSTELHNYECI